jgi:glycine/D-amino acid oxidase-like deaminating enzyme
MGGGEIPKGFPVPNPTESYWQLPPHRIANHRTTPSLPGDIILDYVIIGSGISGAAIAHKLLSRDSSLKISMLEARTAASGASGRNGGQCRAGWWVSFKKYADAFGEEDAIKFETLEEQNVQDIASFVREHNVDCDFQDVETCDAYVTQEAWAQVLEVMKIRDEVRKKRGDNSPEKRKVFEGKEAQKHLGLPGLAGAITYPAHTQNPYLLVCRMLELSLAKGLNLQTNTPAFSITATTTKDEGGARWTVETDRGILRTKNAVLATNAYTNALLPSLAKTKFLKPSRSQVTAIRPAKGDLLNHPTLHKSVILDDRPPSGDYFLIRAPHLKGAGDVLYGGGRGITPTRDMGVTDDSTVNPKIAAYLKSSVPEVFGKVGWGEESTEVRDWSGITCYTPDTFPLVGEVPGEGGLWASVGMNGHGMAMAFRSAEALVDMMAEGREPEWFPKCFRIERAWAKEGRVEFKPAVFEIL